MITNIEASYRRDRLCLGKELPLDMPLSLIIDISEKCNFRCSYCFRAKERDESWDYAAKNNLMPADSFREIIRQLSAFPGKIKSISLSGHGEPLCNPDIIDMVHALCAANVTERIEMHTNASLLTAKTAEEIAKAGFSRIVVSLQGLDGDTYKRVCGVKVDWDVFYKSLQILYNNKNDSLQLHIKISDAALSPENAERERFYAMFGEIADTVSVEEVTPLWRNMGGAMDKGTNKYGQDIGKVECCPILFYKMWVAPDGEIYPCTGLPAPMSLGNIKQVTLYEAWNGQKRRNFLIKHLRFSRECSSVCADCFVPVNTITMEKDRIDLYRDEILKRLEGDCG
ncbi:MAG: radical SAM protein [Oscillospiraceae bacterium]|jgi:radical SAM protein with 4Fe4S-binding SPASM domain|nr:radical SAM protein [Oscillospiraceae bacterium]